MKLGTKLFVAIAALGFVGVLPLVLRWGSAPLVDSGSASGSSLRTVIVIRDGAPITSALVRERVCAAAPHCQNGRGGIHVGVLKIGSIPPRPVSATVETDENCMPDAYGISHCTNALRLPDGSRLVLRHDHNMQAYPCLRPGEIVTLEGQPSL